MQGMPGRAITRLTGPPLAADTPETREIMQSKFVPPPQHQMTATRVRRPPSNVLTEEAVGKAILSFHRGLGAGPSGLRPDLLKQIIGPKGDKASIVPLTEFCNLLADGQAPIGVQPFLAGANGFAFQKESKTEQAEAMEASESSLTRGSTPCQPDARPVCCGEVWRRLVGKAVLDGEKGTLVDYLKPFQLAVAVPCGAEVMPHLARA